MLPPTDRMGQVGLKDALRSGHICAGGCGKTEPQPREPLDSAPLRIPHQLRFQKKVNQVWKGFKNKSQGWGGRGPLRL